MKALTYQPQLYANFVDEMAHYLTGYHYPECESDEGWPSVPEHIVKNQFLASGYFSSVWAIPGEPYMVLKVSHRESDACRAYMEWVLTHPHPNAPKIHTIEYRENLMLIVMDRYYSIPSCEREDVPGYKTLVNGKRPKHNLGHEQLCMTIRRTFKGCKFDLHSDNVMLDRHGNFIITDPVSFTEEYRSCY